MISAFVAYSQTTGNATAKGSCIVANTGSDAKINQTCLAVDPELFAQFKDIADQTTHNGALLANVLTQLRAMAKQLRNGAVQVNNAPGGFATSGGTLFNPTVNNNTFAGSHMPPRIEWTQQSQLPSDNQMERPLGKHPGVRLTIKVESVFYNPAFAIKCDRPCQATTAGTSGVSSAQMLSSRHNPDQTGAAFAMPSQIFPGMDVSITVRSLDEQPVTVVKAEAYAVPQ